MSTIPKEWMGKIDTASESENIYEPKYGGKDHSGYGTIMKYEINDERMDAFVNGAKWMYEQLATEGREELEKKVKELEEMFDTNWMEKYFIAFDQISALQSQCTEKDQIIERLTKNMKEGYEFSSKQIEELKADNEKLIMLTRKLMVGGN